MVGRTAIPVTPDAGALTTFVGKRTVLGKTCQQSEKQAKCEICQLYYSKANLARHRIRAHGVSPRASAAAPVVCTVEVVEVVEAVTGGTSTGSIDIDPPLHA